MNSYRTLWNEFAIKLNKKLKQFVHNHLEIPASISFIEFDLLNAIDMVSPNRERAYLIYLSVLGQPNIDDEIIDMVGMAVESQIISLYIADDIIDNNYSRLEHDTLNKKYSPGVASMVSNIFLNISYQILEMIKNRLPIHAVSRIIESYKSIAFSQIETGLYHYDFNRETEAKEILDMYARLVGKAYATYISLFAEPGTTRFENLYNFGMSLGIALQVKNDIADFVDDPKVAGIPAYQDLLNNQANIVISNLLHNKRLLNAEEIFEMNHLMGKKDILISVAEENLLMGILKKTNAISDSLCILSNLLNNCVDSYSQAGVFHEKKKIDEFILDIILKL